MKVTKGKAAARKDKKEALKPVEDRRLGKRKAALKADKSTKKLAKKEKLAKKDPNKPKRPPSAFFVFLEEFRKVYKQEHPNVKAVSAVRRNENLTLGLCMLQLKVGKAGGEKWKSLSEADKAPYEAKAAKRKSDYEKLMAAYNKKQESMADDDEEESDRSKSEVNDEDEETGEEEEEDEDEDED
ncbi:High mobility group B protein 1 [Vitis vinifera]|uniref:High mobility group B protein 1 n=1 Tax=Vitis vinifera TaxID=29760 RepID=A0A438D5F5_VITVI|nr:High mobility group B protein 1 [Vitis vinifera]